MVDQTAGVKRFVRWEEMSVLVSAERLSERIISVLKERKAPLQDLTVRFGDGEIVLSGRFAILMPVTLSVRQILSDGTRLFIQLSAQNSRVATTILLALGQQLGKLPDGVVLEPTEGRVVVELGRFLPYFLDVSVLKAEIRKEGVALQLGPGGIDPPPGAGRP